jgi:hypothetical protein
MAVRLFICAFLIVAVALATGSMKQSHSFGSEAMALVSMIDEVRKSPDVTKVTVVIDTVTISKTVGPDGGVVQNDIGLVSVEVFYDSASVAIPPMVLSFDQIEFSEIVDTTYYNEESGRVKSER